MSRFKSLLLTLPLLAMFTTPAKAIDHEIKFSVLAPEGSTWVKVLQEMSKELEQKSGGKLALKIYAGGVSGDERDVLRKMRRFYRRWPGNHFTQCARVRITFSI